MIRSDPKNKSAKWKPLLLGTGIAALLFFACALIFAAICYATDNPTGHLRLASLAAFLCSGALSAFLLSRLGRERHPLLSLLPLLAFALSLLLIALILSGGKLPLYMPMNLLCYLLVGALFSLLGRWKKKKTRRRAGR